MNFAKIYAFIAFGFFLLLSRTEGGNLCSCYSFYNKTDGMAWPQARDSCNYKSKTLVVMETEREWEFITNEIQNRVGNENGEWFIGLERNYTTAKLWTWINGKPLTIDKWLRFNPDPHDFYSLIHKEFPGGYKGSFSTIMGNIKRGWICEEGTDNCQGDCFFHAVSTSTSPPVTKAISTRGKTLTEPDITSPPGTKAVNTRGKTSTDQYITDLSGSSTNFFTPTSEKLTDEVLLDDNSSSSLTVMIAAASLGVVFFVALIILIVVMLLRRKKRQGEDAENAKPWKSGPYKNQHDHGESLPLNALNIGAQLSLAPGNERNRSEPFVQQEGVYTALCSETMMTSGEDGSRTYTSLVKSTEEDSDIYYVNQIPAPEYVNA